MWPDSIFESVWATPSLLVSVKSGAFFPSETVMLPPVGIDFNSRKCSSITTFDKLYSFYPLNKVCRYSVERPMKGIYMLLLHLSCRETCVKCCYQRVVKCSKL